MTLEITILIVEILYIIVQVQNTDAGGSGCGCSAVVASGYLYKKLIRKEIKSVLLVSTGSVNEHYFFSSR